MSEELYRQEIAALTPTQLLNTNGRKHLFPRNNEMKNISNHRNNYITINSETADK